MNIRHNGRADYARPLTRYDWTVFALLASLAVGGVAYEISRIKAKQRTPAVPVATVNRKNAVAEQHVAAPTNADHAVR